MVEIRLSFCFAVTWLFLGGVAWETGQTMKYESPSTQGSTSIRIVRPPRIRAYGSIEFGGRTGTGNRDDADGLLVLLQHSSRTWSRGIYMFCVPPSGQADMIVVDTFMDCTDTCTE